MRAGGFGRPRSRRTWKLHFIKARSVRPFGFLLSIPTTCHVHSPRSLTMRTVRGDVRSLSPHLSPSLLSSHHGPPPLEPVLQPPLRLRLRLLRVHVRHVQLVQPVQLVQHVLRPGGVLPVRHVHQRLLQPAAVRGVLVGLLRHRRGWRRVLHWVVVLQLKLVAPAFEPTGGGV